MNIRIYFLLRIDSSKKSMEKETDILLMEQILQQVIDSWSHYLQGFPYIQTAVVLQDFFHQQYLRISCILPVFHTNPPPPWRISPSGSGFQVWVPIVAVFFQVSFQSYFDFVGHHQLLNPFKSKDSQSILLMWTWSIPVELKQKAEDFVVDLRNFIFSIDEFGGEGAMEVKLTGNIILDHEMKASLMVVVGKMDGCYWDCFLKGRFWYVVWEEAIFESTKNKSERCLCLSWNTRIMEVQHKTLGDKHILQSSRVSFFIFHGLRRGRVNLKTTKKGCMSLSYCWCKTSCTTW